MSTDLGHDPEDDDLSRERLQDEEAARYPGHEDPDAARERAGLGGHEGQPDEPPLPGPADS
jgi:hypothetical protein